MPTEAIWYGGEGWGSASLPKGGRYAYFAVISSHEAGKTTCTGGVKEGGFTINGQDYIKWNPNNISINLLWFKLT